MALKHRDHETLGDTEKTDRPREGVIAIRPETVPASVEMGAGGTPDLTQSVNIARNRWRR